LFYNAVEAQQLSVIKFIYNARVHIFLLTYFLESRPVDIGVTLS